MLASAMGDLIGLTVVGWFICFIMWIWLAADINQIKKNTRETYSEVFDLREAVERIERIAMHTTKMKPPPPSPPA